MSETQLHGMADLKRALDGLDGRLKAKILRGAARAMSATARKRARELVPVESGTLKRSIRISAPTSYERRALESRGMVVSTLKSGNEDAWYAHMVELGTAPHSLAKGARLSYNRKQDEGRQHTGTQPRSYMRRALDESQKEAIAAAARYIARRMVRGR
jgi:HK97 gp10 family phage protein